MGEFPGFVSKTDETRIQTCPGVLTRRKGEVCYVTEKVDGSSITVFYVPRGIPGLPNKFLEDNDSENIFGVCSRKLCVKFSEDNGYWKGVLHHNVADKLYSYGKPIVLQGELYGAGIQDNKYKMQSIRIAWYNVFDPIERKYAGFNEFQDILNKLDQPSVPVLDKNFVLDHTVEQLVNYSMGTSVYNNKTLREGIVIRPLVESEERYLGRFSFKVINPEFLVKYNG